MGSRVTILLDIALDADAVVALAEHRGRPVESIIREIAGDLECRCVDACRWRQGVDRVGSSVAVSITELGTSSPS
jgi:hypothetical protein